MGAAWPSGGVRTVCTARLLFSKGVLTACLVATSASFMSGKTCCAAKAREPSSLSTTASMRSIPVPWRLR